MNLLRNFKDSIKERFKNKIFILALAFTIYYFFFQLFYRSTAEVLNNTYYIDKFVHALFGYTLFSFWFVFMKKSNIKNNLSGFLSFVFVVVISVLKEITDYYSITGIGIFSIEDIIATIVGIGLFYFADYRKMK